MNVNHVNLEQLLKEAYIKKIPIFIWGATGIGKSYTVKKVARDIAKGQGLNYNEDITKINDDKNFSIVDIRVSQLDPSDLRGLPKLDNGVTKWLPPNWLPRGGRGILFFDELNLAPPSIQASCYQLVLDRRIGDYTLPDGWVVVSAGNRLEDRANVFELPAPLKNRFCHVTLNIPSIEEWTEWASKNGVDGRIIAFLNHKSSLLFKFDPESKDNAFPTPRSWEVASRWIKDKGFDEEKFEIMVGSAVGQAVAVEFSAFLKLQRKINIDELFENPEKVKEIEDIDLKYFVVGAVAERCVKDKKLMERAFDITLNLEPEFAVLLLRLIKGMCDDDLKNYVGMKKLSEVAERYGKFVL